MADDGADRQAYSMALYKASSDWTLRCKSAPNVALASLKVFLKENGIGLLDEAEADEDSKAAALDRAVQAIAKANAEPENGTAEMAAVAAPLEFARDVELERKQIQQNPSAFQSVSAALIYSGLVLSLAIIAKLKYNDGKWSLEPGIPDLKHFAEVAKGLFKLG